VPTIQIPGNGFIASLHPEWLRGRVAKARGVHPNSKYAVECFRQLVEHCEAFC